MKPSLVPIACGTALALMAGAAAAHWCSVRDMVKLAGTLPARPAPTVRPQMPLSPLPDESHAREAQALLAQVRGTAKKQIEPAAHATTGSRPAATKTGEERFDRFLSAFEGILEENRQLRENIADTNRDLMELQFRVDMYDGEFRPLKVEEEPAYYDDGSGGVLPPLE